MNFDFDEDQQLLRDSVRRFVDHHAALDSLRPRLETDAIFERDVWRSGAALGWSSMFVGEDCGGGSVTAQPTVDAIVFAEELGRVLYSGPFVPTNVVAAVVNRYGTEEQRVRWLPGMASGEVLASWCLSEDGTPHPRAPRPALTRTANGKGWQLTGRSAYVEGADLASVLLVTARDDAGDLVNVLVPRNAEGVSIRVLDALDLTRRFAVVDFDAVPLDDTAVVGSRDDSSAIVATALDLATVLTGAQAVGACEHLVATTVQYAKDRVQFGRPIGSFQAIKHRLADLLMTVEAMRASVCMAALALDEAWPDASSAVSTTGAYTGDAYARVCGEALQLHGGIAFTWEHDVHLYLRRAKVDQTLHGDPSWHRERLCAAVTS